MNALRLLGSPLLCFLCTLMSAVSPLCAVAQDVHSSLPDFNPVLLNPAYTGFFDGKARLGLAYRNQWAAVSRPYGTLSLTAELAVYRERYGRSGVNVGLFAYRDRAGSLHYGSTSANAIVSAFISPSPSHFLSAALELGYGQSGYDVTDLSLFDPAEALASHTAHYFQLGAGLAWYYYCSPSFSLRLGISGRNLNRPNISFLGLDDAYLYPRWNIYARAQWLCGSSMALLPVVLYERQNAYNRLLYGFDVRWFVDDEGEHPFALGCGVAFRQGDAVVLNVLVEYASLALAVSYDANISRLAQASHSVGALELQLAFRFRNSQRKRIRPLPCPSM